MAGIMSLVIHLALLPIFIGMFYVLFALRLPLMTFDFGAEGAGIMAGVGGFLMWSGVYYLREMRRQSAERYLIKAGGLLHDGQRTVVSGIVEAQGPLLSAPFSGRECLGYRYSTHRISKSSTIHSDIHDYKGHALTPSAIRASQGTIKILAPSDPGFFNPLGWPNVGSPENRQRAKAYVRSVDYGKPIAPLKEVSRLETFKGPGSFRFDQQFRQPPEDLFEMNDSDLLETILRPGERVTLTGVYSTAQGGIGPDPDFITYSFCIKPGEPADLEQKIRANRIKAMVWVALSGVATAVYFLVILPRFS